MPLDGNKTNVVKLAAESVVHFNRTMVKWIGKFVCSAAGSGTLTQGGTVYDALAATGDFLVVRANTPIKSASAIGITIVGTDQADGALTGTAQIAAYAPEGQSYNVVTSDATKKFKTITSVTISNGVNGDGFDFAVLPAEADDTEIKFIQGFAPDLGNEVKAIYYRYDHDHNKRIRGERKLTLPSFYVNNLSGVALLHNRDVVIRQDINDDGGNVISEVMYLDKCRLSVKKDTPSAHDGEITCNGEGSFGKWLVFS